MKPKTNSLWFLKKILTIFKFFHTLWTNENETWKIEKLKNPGNRFSTYAQLIGCNIKSMRPRKKNLTSWNNWNIELSNDTLIVKIERKLFPQLLIPLLHSFFLRHPVFVKIVKPSGWKEKDSPKSTDLMVEQRRRSVVID